MPEFELKDVRGPIDLPANYFAVFVVLAVALCVGGFFLARWLLAKVKISQQTPLLRKSPWEIALEQLAELQAQNLPARGEIQEYFVRLSGIVRHYLEDRFAVNAPEMTTDEFLVYIKTLSVLNDQQKESLKEFLIFSDMVKFARYGSTVSEMTDAFEVAKRLVTETTPAAVLSPA